MFIVSKKMDDQWIEVATTDDRASGEKLIAALSAHWPAEYDIRESVPDGPAQQ